MQSTSTLDAIRDNPRLHGVDPTSRRDVWVKKLLYPAHTLPTAIAPVLVGVGFAVHDGVFAPLPALGVFVFGYLVQLGGVLADNYYNLTRYHNDGEHPALVYAIDHGLIRLVEIRNAFLATFVVAAIVGLGLVWVGGIPVVVVGLASIAVSLLYSAEITDVPLNDVFFFCFFGPISVGGTYYLQAVAAAGAWFPSWFPPGSLPLAVVVAGIPVGALTTNILVVDNIRDLEFDREKNDPTLTVVFGTAFSRRQFDALLVLAYLSPIALWAGLGVGPAVLLPLVSIPVAVRVARELRTATTYVELHPMSPRSGQLLVLFSALLAVGAAVGLGSA